MTRKGIVLAGGSGTRLRPLTLATSKQLLPVYDKPMVYYPISVLMLAGIQDILIITTPEDQSTFQRLLGDGAQWGVRLSYQAQARPEGLAQAFILGETFLDGSSSAMILGDNIFFGHGLMSKLDDAAALAVGATVFGYRVSDPQRYGVVTLDGQGHPIEIEEKPAQPRSNFAVTGLYFYDSRAPTFAKSLKPSARGELEITDLNRLYLAEQALTIQLLGRGYAWFDAGTHESLLQAGEFVRTIEERQGLKLACLEEIAFHQGWISAGDLAAAARRFAHTGYGAYLSRLADENGG